MSGTGQDLIRLSLAAAQSQAAGLDAQDLAWMSCLVQMDRIERLRPEQRGQSLCRALMAPYPRGFFEALRACGGLKRFLPELDQLYAQALPVGAASDATPSLVAPHAAEVQLRVLDRLAASGAPLEHRLAGLLHRIGGMPPEGDRCLDRAVDRLRPTRPGETALAVLAALSERCQLPEARLVLCRQLIRHRDRLLHLADGDPEAVLQLLLELGCPDQPQTLGTLLHLCQLEYEATVGRPGFVQARWWLRMQAVLLAVSVPGAQADPGHDLTRRQAQLARLRQILLQAPFRQASGPSPPPPWR